MFSSSAFKISFLTVRITGLMIFDKRNDEIQFYFILHLEIFAGIQNPFIEQSIFPPLI